MPPRQKVRSYNQQTGEPVYDENLPSPMEGDPLAPLPDLDRASEISLANSLATVNPNLVPPMSDDQSLSAPEDVVNDVAAQPEVRRGEANVVPTGVAMDLGFFNQLNSARDQEEFNKMYDALPKVQQHVYDRSFGQKITPVWAAQKADEFFKMQDERARTSEDPVKQAQLAERNAKVVERQAVQNDFKIRRQNTIKNIEEILKDPEYSSLVGPVDGTLGRAYDAAFNQKMQAKRAKLDRLINIDVLDMTKYLRPISQDELKYLRSLVPGQTQHWEVYQQYLGEKLDMLKAADRAVVNPATNQPLPSEDGQPAAQPQQNVYQQSQQNPASQLRGQLESSDTLTLPNGRVLKKVRNQDGSIGWSE